MSDSQKQREREAPSFANINLLGRCNCDCFFCLGKDIEKELEGQDQLSTHYTDWPNFLPFLDSCHLAGIQKLYITGQNCDSLQYKHLSDLVDYLQRWDDFEVGLRTNGYLADDETEDEEGMPPGEPIINIINRCRLETGYTILSLNQVTNQMICRRHDLPDWKSIIPMTERPRVQVVINRINQPEFFEIVRYVKEQFENVPYVQARRISTDTRQELLQPDINAFEELYTWVKRIFPMTRRLWGDAEEFDIYGMPTVFWRTVKTTVNSYNYFTDGTISKEYFIVEGYLENRKGA